MEANPKGLQSAGWWLEKPGHTLCSLLLSQFPPIVTEIVITLYSLYIYVYIEIYTIYTYIQYILCINTVCIYISQYPNSISISQELVLTCSRSEAPCDPATLWRDRPARSELLRPWRCNRARSRAQHGTTGDPSHTNDPKRMIIIGQIE